MLYLQFLGSYNICTIYLHGIDACFKVIIAMFYFCHSKDPSIIMKNTLNSLSRSSHQRSGLACNFIKKETLAQVFFCEFCKISKSTFLHRTPLMAASSSLYFLEKTILLMNDTHREKLVLIEFNTKIHWNSRLAASEVFHMFTQSIKFF